MNKLLRIQVASLSLLLFTSLLQAQEADATLPQLIEWLSSSEVQQRRDAGYELVRRADHSTDTLNAWKKALRDEDTQVRCLALRGLALVGTAAEPLMNDMIEMLGDRDDQIRFRAAEALGRIGPKAIEPLLAAWDKATERSKVNIAEALAIIGPEANSAIDKLKSAMDNSGNSARYFAKALVDIAPHDQTIKIELAKHKQSGARLTGIAALASISEPTAEVVELLQAAVKDDEAQVREVAILAIAKSSASATQKSDAVAAGLMEESQSVRAASIVAMRRANLTTQEFARRLVSQLNGANPPAAESIVKALGVIGPKAQESLPELLEASEKLNIPVENLAFTLANFGEAAVPDLLKALEKHPNLEPVIAQALAQIGAPAIQSLMAGMTNENELVRAAATRALGNVQPITPAIIESLSKALQDPAAKIRALAVKSLLSVGSGEVKPLLLKTLEDGSAEVRAAAVQLAAKTDFTDEECQAAIVKGLGDQVAQVRVAALEAVGTSPKLLASNLAAILPLGSESDEQVRRLAIQVLAKLKKDAVQPEVVQIILKGLGDSSNAVRLAATESTAELELNNLDVLKAVAANLGDNPDLMRASLDAITGFRDKAADLIPAIVELQQHPKADVRVAAINALAAIESNKENLAGRLTDALDDKEWEVRRLAAVNLGKLGADAKNSVPKLFGMLSNPDDMDFANSTLREINTAPVEAIPLLMKNLDSEERRVAYYAISLLGKIGPPAIEALPRLEAMLETESPGSGRTEFRRRFLREAIAAIKGEPKPSDK